MYTRADFEHIARIIKKFTSPKDKEIAVIEFIKVFKADNPRFDSAKFLQAAGMESNQRTASVESVSPSGGKSSFKVNESFDNVGMKLVELLPTGKIEGRKTFVREAPIDRASNAYDKEEVINDLNDELEELEDVAQDKLDKILDAAVEDGASIGLDLRKAKQTIQTGCYQFWKNTRNIMHMEWKKSRGYGPK